VNIKFVAGPELHREPHPYRHAPPALLPAPKNKFKSDTDEKISQLQSKGVIL
jgi:hypothetical protein